MGCRDDGGLENSRAMPLNPPLPAQSQVWQWTTGKGYSASSEIPGNGARGGSCAMLTHHSGECPVPAPPSSVWARPALPRLPPPPGPIPWEGCSGHSWCPSSPWPSPAPCLSLLQSSLCGPVRTAPGNTISSASSTPCTEHSPGPWRTPRRPRSSPATSDSPCNSYKSYKKRSMRVLCELGAVQSPELVREGERRALPRLPELPGFQRLLCCGCGQSWGMSP